ncbi:hypothetical protein HV454_15605 [Bacillus sporothermodurans]|uniref:hypothetical protein n=1 Tax=Heyndrickxia sporothermodurans TaxID=46224 RepID=UPI00192AE04C|nr:hypothetical protein [Heyndrickxia sporothermodurans]MBL5769035.1 hypothetical protein [Heyndrickxia sporothermodurans]MBL5786908.1 hypothetical protein [Heyndrickxia sporothermodurans]MBL5850646.1 hypothetical protein [Heyndrickxia sporothermodurans]MBL5878357.1 hypothetical protein [Heyndrickxia sporothermodurans]MBL5910058.1 hypothetical protein [Heyndrickxia sporothermodurans]
MNELEKVIDKQIMNVLPIKSQINNDVVKYVEPDIWSFVVDATFEEVEDTEDERILSIVYCTECHSWKLCD